MANFELPMKHVTKHAVLVAYAYVHYALQESEASCLHSHLKHKKINNMLKVQSNIVRRVTDFPRVRVEATPVAIVKPVARNPVDNSAAGQAFCAYLDSMSGDAVAKAWGNAELLQAPRTTDFLKQAFEDLTFEHKNQVLKNLAILQQQKNVMPKLAQQQTQQAKQQQQQAEAPQKKSRTTTKERYQCGKLQAFDQCRRAGNLFKVKNDSDALVAFNDIKLEYLCYDDKSVIVYRAGARGLPAVGYFEKGEEIFLQKHQTQLTFTRNYSSPKTLTRKKWDETLVMDRQQDGELKMHAHGGPKSPEKFTVTFAQVKLTSREKFTATFATLDKI